MHSTKCNTSGGFVIYFCVGLREAAVLEPADGHHVRRDERLRSLASRAGAPTWRNGRRSTRRGSERRTRIRPSWNSDRPCKRCNMLREGMLVDMYG